MEYISHFEVLFKKVVKERYTTIFGKFINKKFFFIYEKYLTSLRSRNMLIFEGFPHFELSMKMLYQKPKKKF